MNIVLAILIGWVLVSVLVALFLGAVIDWGTNDDDHPW